MATRLTNRQVSEVLEHAHRQGSALVNMLCDYALTGKYNDAKVDTSRIRAAEVILRKLVPDRKATEMDVDASLTVNVIDYGRPDNTQ